MAPPSLRGNCDLLTLTVTTDSCERKASASSSRNPSRRSAIRDRVGRSSRAVESPVTCPAFTCATLSIANVRDRRPAVGGNKTLEAACEHEEEPIRLSVDQQPIRVALIGYGFGGSIFHAPFISNEPRLDLVAVVTNSPERRSKLEGDYPDVAVLGHVDELVEEIGAIDLVVVSTPNPTHVDIAHQFLGRGRSVVVDKPVAPTATEVRHLAAVAAHTGSSIVPFQNRRWDGDFRTVEALVASGEIGVLYDIESRYERWQPVLSDDPRRSWKQSAARGAGTGILFDLGTHIIDQAVVLFGRPTAVFAQRATRRRGAQVDDDSFVALSYPEGPRVHLYASAVAADQGPRFRLLASNGAYVKFGMDPQEAALVAGRHPNEAHWGEEEASSFGTLTVGTERRPLPTLPGSYQLFYAGLAAHLIDKAPPPVDIADAIISAEIVEAALRSSRTGSVAKLTNR